MAIHDLFGKGGKKDPEKKSDDERSGEEFVQAEIFEGQEHIDFEKMKLGKGQESFSWKIHLLFSLFCVLVAGVFVLHLGLMAMVLAFNIVTLFQIPILREALKRYFTRVKIFLITTIISFVGIISPSLSIMLLMTCLMVFVKKSSDDRFMSSILHWCNNKF
ncbi:hypothetical protein AB751O23_CO_00040 [Chlamydiales bacterium SCGC AB-751-O23]|jgi:hypothetical protein|nr:hypothetical protein AB751O23_CO_00040 [Chlamydiales bacterium SCGC AB-751-O23]